MKPFISGIALILLCLTTADAQPLTFHKLIGSSPNQSYAHDSYQAYDSTYMFIGNRFAAGGSDMYIVKLDRDGKLIYADTYDGLRNEWFSSFTPTTDSGLALFGYSRPPFGSQGDTSAYLLKVDEQGNIKWARSYSATKALEGKSIHRCPTGGYLLGMETPGSEVHIIVTDSLSVELWGRTYTNIHSLVSAQQLWNGDYVLLGGVKNSPSSSTELILFKTNDSGTVLWSKRIPIIPTALIPTKDSALLVLAYDVILKVNTLGNIIWQKHYNSALYFTSAKETKDGFIVTGHQGGSKTKMTLLSLDTTGNILWGKQYGTSTSGMGTDANYVYSVTKAFDGGYMLSGYNASNHPPRFYILKTDALGESGCFQNVTTMGSAPSSLSFFNHSITTSGASIYSLPVTPNRLSANDVFATRCTNSLAVADVAHSVDDIKVFPNPTNDHVTIEAPGNIGNSKVFDGVGRLLTIPLKRRANSIELDMTNFPSGLYFLAVSFENRPMTIKFIKN